MGGHERQEFGRQPRWLARPPGTLVEVQIPNVFRTLDALGVAFDPADVGLFGTDGMVLETDSLMDLVQQFLRALLLRRLPPQSLQRGFRIHDMGVVGLVPQSSLITKSPGIIAGIRRKSTFGGAIPNLFSPGTGVDRPNYFGLLTSWAALKL
jgi:hypothetical protein